MSHRTLDHYIEEIGRIPLLSPSDEVALIRRWRGGDEAALETLVTANLRFVVSVARKYQGRGTPLEDLINEGNCGLITAALRFDETRGFKFISYAVWWIRQSILQALSDNGRVVRIPINRVTHINKIRKATQRLAQRHHRASRPDELATETGLQADKVLDALRNMHTSVSVHERFTVDGDSTLLDLLADEGAPAPDAALWSDAREIDTALAGLKQREAYVIRAYFGLDEDSATLEDVGTRLGLTRERVRQIRDAGLAKLRVTLLEQRADAPD